MIKFEGNPEPSSTSEQEPRQPSVRPIHFEYQQQRDYRRQENPQPPKLKKTKKLIQHPLHC